MSELCNERPAHRVVLQCQGPVPLQPGFDDPSAPSGTHRVAVDLLHQLRQAIVFSFSSQFKQVFPVCAICWVGQSAVLHHGRDWMGGQSSQWGGAGNKRQAKRL